MASIKGTAAVTCPNKCEEFEAEVWSFVRGDEDPGLKDAIIFGELNVVRCPHCDAIFMQEMPIVYFDPTKELMVFLLPASYKDEAGKWKEKMDEDFATMRDKVFSEMHIDYAPIVLFGMEDLQKLLEGDEYETAEADVIEFVAKEKGFGLKKVRPSAARDGGFSLVMPFKKTEDVSGALAAAEEILAEHPMMAGLKKLAESLRAENAKLPACK